MQTHPIEKTRRSWFRLRARQPVKPGRKSGQGIVEFALCMPLMLFLLLGTLDFGQIFFEYIQMRGAVREGAVYAARYSANGEAATESAVLMAAGDDGILDDGQTDVTVLYSQDLADIDYGESAIVTVTAERTFHPTILSFFQQFGLDTVQLSASSSAKVWT
jgi:Flp pilus assembly protein TadG